MEEVGVSFKQSHRGVSTEASAKDWNCLFGDSSEPFLTIMGDIGDDGLAMVTLVILFLLSNDNGLASETATPKVASGGGGEGGTVETDPEARINYTNISRDRSGTSQLQNCCRNYFFLFASIS